jgi:hypothetical protein
MMTCTSSDDKVPPERDPNELYGAPPLSHQDSLQNAETPQTMPIVAERVVVPTIRYRRHEFHVDEVSDVTSARREWCA